MEQSQRAVASQATLIGDRMLAMFEDRWPFVFRSLSLECRASLRAIVVNDIDCLLRALQGEKEAALAFSFFREEMARLNEKKMNEEKNRRARNERQKIFWAEYDKMKGEE